MMNTNWISFHLREALEELTRTITAVENVPEYDEARFKVAIEHLYNHLNTAWNSRNADAKATTECSDDDFYAWRAFPSDISMGP
jgi:hypothetical protein